MALHHPFIVPLKVLAALLLVAPVAYSEGVTVKLEGRNIQNLPSNCRATMIQVAMKMFSGPGSVHMGLSFAEFSTVLEASGMTKDGREAIEGVLGKVADQGGNDLILGDTLGYLRMPESNEHQSRQGSGLAFIVPHREFGRGPELLGRHGNSEDNNLLNQSAHAMGPYNFEINPSRDTAGDLAPPAPHPETVGLLREEFIALHHFDVGTELNDVNHPDQRRAMLNRMTLATHIGQMMRDTTRPATHHLISEWIRANYKLKSKGEKTDGYFDKWITLLDNNHVRIDPKFYEVLMVSRTVDAWTKAEGIVLDNYSGISDPEVKKGLLRSQDEGHRRAAVREMVEKAGQDRVDQLNITPQNVFEKGRKISENMIETIRRSQRFENPH